VALLIQSLTDNPTRTVADVRHKLSRGGGNLGTTGSVAFMFDRKGRCSSTPAATTRTRDGGGARGRAPRTCARDETSTW
jgi:transcriptional/translational regulatory protein YebC/TACO1